MKVILEKVFRSDKETKFGPRKSVGLKVTNKTLTLEGGKTVDNSENKWISTMFKEGEYAFMDKWTEGMEVDISIEQKGDYLNFKPTDEIVLRVEALEKAVFGSENPKTGSVSSEATADDIKL